MTWNFQIADRKRKQKAQYRAISHVLVTYITYILSETRHLNLHRMIYTANTDYVIVLVSPFLH